MVIMASVTLLELVFLEIILSLIYKNDLPILWQTTGAHILDADLVYRNRPNYHGRDQRPPDFNEEYTINSSGFRDEEIKKDFKGKKILFVGDSMVFGSGISDNAKTVPNLLEAKLPKTDVLNAGVKGYTPDQEYRFIINNSRQFKPDVIIWQLNPHDYANLAYGSVLYDINTQSQLVPLKGNLTATYWYGWAINRLPEFVKDRALVRILIKSFWGIPYLNRSMMIPEEKKEDWVKSKLNLQIEEVIKYCQAENINLVFVLFPVKYSYTGNGQAYNLQYPLYEKIITEAGNLIKKNDIVLIDVGRIIYDRGRISQNNYSDGFFYRDDYHFNEKGAEMAADILAKELTFIFE